MSGLEYFGFVFSDVSSFVTNLARRRDATFHLCGEVCRFISRLCFRVYQPDTVPLESAWFHLLDFRVSDGKFLEDGEFLIRLNMTNKVTAASNLKAAGLHFNKKSSKAAIDKTAETAKADFANSAKKYIEYLLGAVLQHPGFSSDPIKGLAAFDPYLMMKRPTEVALRHFGILYSTFQLRSWVTAANEALCRDQYLALLDYLRTNHGSDPSLALESLDLIDFLMGLEFLQSNEHIFHLFKLCCLCLTSVSPQYPSVFMGNIDTTDFQSRVADVILPCQSYLSEVTDSLAPVVQRPVLTSSPSFLLRLASLGSLPITILGLMWIPSAAQLFTSLSFLLIVLFPRGRKYVLNVQWQPILPPSKMCQLSNCLVTVSEGEWIKANPVRGPPL